MRMRVQPGDHVERGTILFETVEGEIDDLSMLSGDIIPSVAGVIAEIDVTNGSSIEKGEKLATILPLSSFQLEVEVSERDLNSIHEGDIVAIEFDCDPAGNERRQGIVDSISFLSITESGAAVYNAYVAFEAQEDVRLGMSAKVYRSVEVGDNE